VDLRTGELLPPDPARLMTKVTAARYEPGAEHMDWKAALESVPADVQDWYQVRLGQGVTGHMTSDDVMLVQQGTGENGKTTISGAIRAALGDYYLAVSHRALLADPRSIPTEVADFRGVRLAVLEELPEERRLTVTRLKMLVGTPEITARKLFKDSITFTASHSLFVNTNYAPGVDETDNGTWRRLALVRFPYHWRKPSEERICEDDRHGDPGLRDRLRRGRAQQEAVLAWLVQGAIEWYHDKRVMPPLPERVQRDTRAWRAESDLVLAYLDEHVIFDVESHVISAELFSDFNRWLLGRRLKEWGDKTFTSRLAGHGSVTPHRVEKRKIRSRPGLSRVAHGYPDRSEPNQYHAWLGVRFRTDDDPLPDETENLSERPAHRLGTAGTADSSLPRKSLSRREVQTSRPSRPSRSEPRSGRGF
jgi:putative DNA primase/helicase